jgi:hypothetical protein
MPVATLAAPLSKAASPLTDLPGVGDALALRLEKEFGGAEGFYAAARASEVDRIATVEGISERKAVELVLQVQGRQPLEFLRTPRAQTLYEDVLTRIASFANTSHARNKVSLLVPLPPKEAKERLAFALEARDLVARLDRPAVAKLLSRLARPRQPRPRFDGSVVIVVDTDADREALARAGVDRYCQLTTVEEGPPAAEIIVYAYSQGGLDFTGAENVVQIPFSRHVADLVPDAALAYFRENRPIWEASLELSAILARRSVMREILDALDALESRETRFGSVEKAVEDGVAWMNAELAARTKALSLAGDEVLEMLAGRTPRKVRDLQSAVLREGRERILRETGEDFTSVFTDGFPVRVDEAAMGRKRREIEGRQRRSAFRAKVDAARRLVALREKAEAEVARLLEFDYAFALGSFSLEYGLQPATFGRELKVEGALHLDLARAAGGVPVEYALPRDHQVALLTGANSGGKTTLLETLAQIAILAHLGLPVNARRRRLLLHAEAEPRRRRLRELPQGIPPHRHQQGGEAGARRRAGGHDRAGSGEQDRGHLHRAAEGERKLRRLRHPHGGAGLPLHHRAGRWDRGAGPGRSDEPRGRSIASHELPRSLDSGAHLETPPEPCGRRRKARLRPHLAEVR